MSGKPNLTGPIDEHIGQRLQLRRIMLSMSQKDVAELCNVTFQQLQKYEYATNRISASRLFELSVALQTPISFFFAGLPGYIDREQRNGRLPKHYVSDQASDDPLGKNESLRLINQYWDLPTDKDRAKVMNLIKELLNTKETSGSKQ